MNVHFKKGELVTHFSVDGPIVRYRFCRVFRVGTNGLVLQDVKSDACLEVAFTPNTNHQDFRIKVEYQRNEEGTQRRAQELWTLSAYNRLRVKVDRLIRDMSSETGINTTYPDPYYEKEDALFREHWLNELKEPRLPEIVNSTGLPITEALRPWALKAK